MLEELKEYFNKTPKEQLDKEWKEVSSKYNFGPTVEELFNTPSFKKYNNMKLKGKRKYIKECLDNNFSEYYLYLLIRIKLLRMQKYLKSVPYFDYKQYGTTLTIAIKLLEIYLFEEELNGHYVNLRNANRFTRFDDWMLNHKYKDLYILDVRKEKAFQLFHEVLKRYSGTWWI
jgi:hypothetical protein